jgi:hypothetical protein
MKQKDWAKLGKLAGGVITILGLTLVVTNNTVDFYKNFNEMPNTFMIIFFVIFLGAVIKSDLIEVFK